MSRTAALGLLYLSSLLFSNQSLSIAANEQLGDNTFYGEWQWSDTQGQYQQLKLHFSEDLIHQSEVETFRLSYSLTYPSQAISAYLSPRLEHAVAMINQYVDDPETRLDDILQALRSDSDSPSSKMLWDAYEQYTHDAFRHLGLLPCLHPQGAQYPCVRPNYSQLFYQNRDRVNPIIEHFTQQGDLNRSLAEAQAWLLTIPSKQENNYSFTSPVDVLKDNRADSDERALLLALVLSELAPNYPLYMVYPADSVGSASPAWLTIDASSGIEGPTIIIGDSAHTLVSGSSELIKEMLLAEVQLISDALY
ncbi:hypothetical protein F9L16_22145 [Agarivorans sp. B2Z047]|uniref:hypothetical protein n=1 Tax=Agarivorans sp. B2Z047 TaxID=2652721 RepID=UPI00128C650D|nr:hypothetical protein [Agarivorans sp. B2Z047]MPW31681.1 hypothetical protein [Agarivorans sp. B2Z047]UQN42359.1 hypothetical protein LQZ07_21690 [Agarivorans sp. B2Z047]